MKIVLSKPIEFNGIKHSELDLNLEVLTGNDLIEAEDLLKSKGIPTAGAADFSRNYLLAVCSAALKIPVESLKQLGAKDFTRLMNETLIFLAGTDSESSQAKESGKSI